MANSLDWDELLSRFEAHHAKGGRDLLPQELFPEGTPEQWAELQRRLNNQARVEWLMQSLPSSMEPRTAQIRDYDLIESLGQGAFGSVWKARKHGGNMHVALKIIDLEGTKGQIEYSALNKIKELNSLHMLKIVDFWEDHNWLIVAMELADKSLSDRLNEVQKLGQGGIDRAELLGYLDDAAIGIDYFNTPEIINGVQRDSLIHRDIKPKNLLLIRGRVKLTDFGLVRVMEHTSGSHTGIHTREFAPPEFLRGRTHLRSDQFSLAVTYCYLLSGRFPIIHTVASNCLNGNGGCELDLTMIPSDEHEVIRRALNCDPGERWPNCAEFINRLKAPRTDRVKLSQATDVILSHLRRHATLFFEGREDILRQLETGFMEPSRNHLPQMQMLSGLGGQGKTQIALKYVELHHHQYDYVFWIAAGTVNELTQGFAEIARILDLPLAKDPELSVVAKAARRWLTENNRWFLVLDNADEPQIVIDLLPWNSEGRVLLTSRASVFASVPVQPIPVRSFSVDAAVRFLMKRTKRDRLSPAEQNAATELARELGGLPLALEHAGAYLEASGVHCLFQDYLATFRNQRVQLLTRRKIDLTGNDSAAVATTWLLNVKEVRRCSPASADLMRIIAFFHPDSIPLEILVRGFHKMGERIAKFLENVRIQPILIDDLLGPLTRYSLIDRSVDGFSIHVLVQAVQIASMDREHFSETMQLATATLVMAFPMEDYTNWSLCERLVPHAQKLLRDIASCKAQGLRIKLHRNCWREG